MAPPRPLLRRQFYLAHSPHSWLLYPPTPAPCGLPDSTSWPGPAVAGCSAKAICTCCAAAACMQRYCCWQVLPPGTPLALFFSLLCLHRSHHTTPASQIKHPWLSEGVPLAPVFRSISSRFQPLPHPFSCTALNATPLHSCTFDLCSFTNFFRPPPLRGPSLLCRRRLLPVPNAQVASTDARMPTACKCVFHQCLSPLNPLLLRLLPAQTHLCPHSNQGALRQVSSCFDGSTTFFRPFPPSDLPVVY